MGALHAACLKSAADGPRAGRYTDFSGARRRLQKSLYRLPKKSCFRPPKKSHFRPPKKSCFRPPKKLCFRPPKKSFFRPPKKMVVQKNSPLKKKYHHFSKNFQVGSPPSNEPPEKKIEKKIIFPKDFHFPIEKKKRRRRRRKRKKYIFPIFFFDFFFEK